MPYTSPRPSPSKERFETAVTSTTVRRAPSVRSRSVPALSLRPANHSASSSDDDNPSPKTQSRGRFSLDTETEHKLHDAVAQIKVTRSLSPNASTQDAARPATQTATMSETLTVPSVKPMIQTATLHRVRSSSMDPLGLLVLPLRNHSAIESDADDMSPGPRPPRMIRKKSGELVRSSLKPFGKTGKPRPQSMPSTPVFQKNVHFDRKLEHVRHFLHSEKPAAVSTTTSPTQEYNDHDGFPFHQEDELTIELPNFVPEAQQTDNHGAIIKVETVYLSSDKRSLIGRVAVRNLAFQKYVCVRYTMDNWRTTSECAAEYTKDVRKKQREDGFDRFNFDIKIDDFSGVTDKTMFFCVRYNTNGQDFWDANGGKNFRVEFHKRPVAARRNSDPPVVQRPIFSTAEDEMDLLPDSIQPEGARQSLKSPRSLIFENIYDDHPGSVEEREKPIRFKAPRPKTQDSFSTRYDFGASLSAAISAANSMLQGSGNEIQPRSTVQARGRSNFNPYFAVSPAQVAAAEAGTRSPTFPPALDSSDNTPASSGDVSPVPGVSTTKQPFAEAKSYQELINNYCFFGTGDAQHGSRVSTKAAPSSTLASKEGTGSQLRPHSFTASPYATPPYSSSPPNKAVGHFSRDSNGRVASSEEVSPNLCAGYLSHDSGASTPTIKI
ncbi:putative phosphatase regulatory subunit-domain-containing protein [Protomyces lactucae-debilis]|uniref:Putative phosphatase regulatory subunit-domain-containing protein n=1 Tax=Protomyces lactucae-debilis TaxID=2754530 RepID=A0A1Y2FNY8_PROLT|nr:putative phosphatase regulatory subunit-domain-containing protein [Protomyces lactucae-debilis]ORY85044.1 putative phosphatase regulatory subunit-domain-containing protein [Protomyces lactucae-debilis]